jgi:hypothetical protein
MVIVDFLAEAEMKAAQQVVEEVFHVTPARQCRRFVMGEEAKTRKAGKHERLGKLVKDLRAKAASAGR